MTKIVLLAFMLIQIVSNGQFNTGEKFIGGTFSINHQEDSNITNPNTQFTEFSISPRMGFMVTKKASVGGAVGLGSSSRRYNYVMSFVNSSGGLIYNEITQESSSKYYSVDLFGQRYFVISENFLFSLTCSLSFTRIHSTVTTFNSGGGFLKTPENSYKMKVSGGPSFLFFPSPNWGIYAGLGTIDYTYAYSLSTNAYSNFFNTSFGSFSLGFAYFFRRAYF